LKAEGLSRSKSLTLPGSKKNAQKTSISNGNKGIKRGGQGGRHITEDRKSERRYLKTERKGGGHFSLGKARTKRGERACSTFKIGKTGAETYPRHNRFCKGWKKEKQSVDHVAARKQDRFSRPGTN